MRPQTTVQTNRSPQAFLADVMLGRLARWLRILGHDTAYEKQVNDAELVDRAIKEDRWLLTRDRQLVRRRVLEGRHTLLHSDNLSEQLRQLQREVNVSLALCRDSRCPDCNRVLEHMDSEQAKLLVPAYVASRHVRFVRCPSCARIFWPGSHWDRIRRTLEHLGKG